MVAHAHSPSLEAEEAGGLQIRGQSGPQSKTLSQNTKEKKELKANYRPDLHSCYSMRNGMRTWLQMTNQLQQCNYLPGQFNSMATAEVTATGQQLETDLTM
jgi:hypothetical protein